MNKAGRHDLIKAMIRQEKNRATNGYSARFRGSRGSGNPDNLVS